MEKRTRELKENIELSKKEYDEREERVAAMTEKFEAIEKEYEKLVNANEKIEQSIKDSKDLFEDMKKQLETQEEEIRDKESRIHRLETLGVIYRLSKFFGGLLIFVGLGFILWSLGTIFGILPKVEDVLVIFLLIGAGLTIASGLFHLEKS